MAEGEPILFSILKTIVMYSLERQLTENAIFFAERLRCFYPAEEEAVYLVAKSYYTSGKPSVAAYLLRQQVENHVPSAYLFAKACFDLERYHEGQEALERVLVDKTNSVNVPHEYSPAHPDTAAVHCVMGHLCRNGNKKEEAKTHYLKSFESNPFLWTSYEQLCKMNYKFGIEAGSENADLAPDLSIYFNEEKLLSCYKDIIKGTKLELAIQHHNNLATATTINSTTATSISSQIVREKTPADQPNRSGLTPTNSLSVANVTAAATERPRRMATASTMSKGLRLTTRAKTNALVTRGSNTKLKEGKDPPSLAVKRPKGVDVRKSTRSQTNALRSRSVSEDLMLEDKSKDNGKSSCSGNNSNPLEVIKPSPNLPLSAVAGGSSKQVTPIPIAPELQSSTNIVDSMDTDKQTYDEVTLAVREIMNVLTCMADAFFKLSQNHCAEAIEAFENLPVSQQESGWVMSLIGQARYQVGEFAAADQVFSELRKREPYRMAKMDLYSTVLWQMKQDVKLSYLAHQLVEFDRWSPEAWCAVGNCFSIKFDHMAALKCFQRAIQLNPHHAYAHYLSGMEWMALGDAERAQASYRNAIKVDDRHYNAWFGLGLIYYRQESYDHAEFHFRRAASINLSNPSLQSYIALVMQKTKRYDEALEYFEKADRLSRYPNVLTKFRRAFVLVLLNRNQEALDELHKLELQAQGECNVYYLMGKVYKRLGQNHRAIHYLTMAQDHQVHQSSNIIKDAIDKVSGGMEEDDSATFDELFKKFE